ncbi:FecR family protein [Sphingosinicella rhizophila]|uniref:FecR domain-containing protein n=1 Tax=Sphingosinicella rhizophila TaxID=3050082 RepID=A0ABU3Q9V9_9SPHN|nr:FecR domain-containing protein [Sphingosinicella sp. GR2756]MDT9600195.1 FecR domain-containing protein [Sphingosinicella sp. GR2756]
MTQRGDQGNPGDLLETAGFWCVRVAHGDLSLTEQREFDAWISASDAHGRAFDDVVRTWHSIDAVSLQPDVIAHRSQALEDFSRANSRRWRAPLLRARRLFALAASIALLFLGYGLYDHYAFKTYATTTGERRIVQLDDGSRISLDADSEVKVRYSGDRRELRLARGRAKFDVAKDSLRPFTVLASERIVIATGTAFSVELINRRIEVILYEGRVAVLEDSDRAGPASTSDGPGHPRREVQLLPGMELMTTAAGKELVSQTDASRSLTWEAGLLTFEDEPLQIAVERVNRYSDVKLAVADIGTARLPVNGVYPAGDIRAFVEGVTGVLPVRTELREGVRTFVQ